jgi:DNA invertase Pin-like site-specific DNA recombinase
MNQRVIIYARLCSGQAGTEADLLLDLQQTVESRGDTVVAMFADDGRIVGRGKHAGWREMLACLNQVDLVIVAGAGDLPGRNVADLLKLLGVFRDHHVGLYLHDEEIGTGSTSFAALEIVEAYRRAKLSAAIKAGQAAARAAGRRIGRPVIPPGLVSRIRASLEEGLGVRPTARRFNISPASVINIRRTMTEVVVEAA